MNKLFAKLKSLFDGVDAKVHADVVAFNQRLLKELADVKFDYVHEVSRLTNELAMLKADRDNLLQLLKSGIDSEFQAFERNTFGEAAAIKDVSEAVEEQATTLSAQLKADIKNDGLLVDLKDIPAVPAVPPIPTPSDDPSRQ